MKRKVDSTRGKAKASHKSYNNSTEKQTIAKCCSTTSTSMERESEKKKKKYKTGAYYRVGAVTADAQGQWPFHIYTGMEWSEDTEETLSLLF